MARPLIRICRTATRWEAAAATDSAIAAGTEIAATAARASASGTAAQGEEAEDGEDGWDADAVGFTASEVLELLALLGEGEAGRELDLNGCRDGRASQSDSSDVEVGAAGS